MWFTLHIALNVTLHKRLCITLHTVFNITILQYDLHYTPRSHASCDYFPWLLAPDSVTSQAWPSPPQASLWLVLHERSLQKCSCKLCFYVLVFFVSSIEFYISVEHGEKIYLYKWKRENLCMCVSERKMKTEKEKTAEKEKGKER